MIVKRRYLYVFRRNKKIATVFRGEKNIWVDHEGARDYILEAMMTFEGEDYERYSAIYIQLIHGLNYCADQKNKNVLILFEHALLIYL